VLTSSRRDRIAFYCALIVLVCFTVAVVAYALVPSGSSLSRDREVCDTAVDALLRSNDLVEVFRAATLIDSLGCSVRRRLP
jgi:hypothetical protein